MQRGTSWLWPECGTFFKAWRAYLNENGQNIPDSEKYEPWNTEEFSGRISYELDNGSKYEVYRDFKKKNPKIFNGNLEDISKEFNIDKNKGNQFFYDQIEIEGKNYTIVGIIQTANKNLPDIYTNLETYQTKDYYSNMSVLSDNHYIQFNDGNNYQEIEIHYDYNPYGYDQNEIHNQVEKATKQLQQTFEFIIITLFVLFALTSSSLKKRMKERFD